MMNRDLRVALVMTLSPVGAVAANLANTARWVERAAGQGAALVCFPELNLTGYSTRRELIEPIAQPIPGPLTQHLEKFSRKFDVVILAGMAETDAQGRIFASHVVISPQGTLGVYRKLHLAPPEKELLTAGEGVPLFDLAGIRLGVQLCYDAHFPELSTAQALAGADIIFIPHASPRGLPEDKRISWERHLPARAFDNGLFVVACNQVGDNGQGLTFPGVILAFDPSGKPIAQATAQSEQMVVVDLRRRVMENLRRHPMAYFLSHRREDLFGPP
ncbi:MAG: nitrilase-related carbon-nitrogen hydrolase [Desulfobacterales bacterium]